ncbi:alpha/beta fold hydrolase [Actinomadura sp. HBU206391]|uniref:alpha/beta fold hydrolase n=1 Tax=Actinomadura sp. HBU206391 TaxID=2731692 RepID=UPI001650AA58|nr:alpha/beta hydrolase [Actinomadura sp. HBU206391]MBC6456974.1 alpha/beta hydrolase [Actinomadura sp. HBU206391]
MNAPSLPSSRSDRLVRSAGIDLAVRDYGGDGADVLLLHGGGRSSEDWRLVAPLLTEAGLRVVAVDLRGYGRSGPGLWSWPAAVDDVAAVVSQLELDRPALVGHSLGGLLAAVWATHHEECPLAVNLDGHTNPTGPFAGLDEQEERAARSTMQGFLDTSLAEAGDPALSRLVAELGALDLFAAYRATRCPLVVVSSSGADIQELLPPEVARAFGAYLRGFARELAEAAAATPLLSLIDLPSGHDLHLEAPGEVADIVLARLTGGTER